METSIFSDALVMTPVGWFTNLVLQAILHSGTRSFDGSPRFTDTTGVYHNTLVLLGINSMVPHAKLSPLRG